MLRKPLSIHTADKPTDFAPRMSRFKLSPTKRILERSTLNTSMTLVKRYAEVVLLERCDD